MSEEQVQGGAVESAPAEGISQETPVETSSAPVTEGIAQDSTEYAPNYKFKVMDEEKEIDEYLRPVIKDPETEKKIRELYEKAYGLDYVKPKYESTKKEYEALQQNWNMVSQDVQKVGTFLKNKDFSSFFNAFKLSDEDIFKYAMGRLEYYEMPQEKRAALDAQAQRNQEYANLMMENQQFKQAQQAEENNRFLSSLETAVTAPHVLSISQAFDAKAGKPGAFRDAVIAHGQAQFHVLGRDLEPHEAVESLVRTFGLGSAAASQTPAQAAPASASAPGERPQSLPKVGGSGTSSPVKAKVKSLSDLRKLQENAFSTGHG